MPTLLKWSLMFIPHPLPQLTFWFNLQPFFFYIWYDAFLDKIIKAGPLARQKAPLASKNNKFCGNTKKAELVNVSPEPSPCQLGLFFLANLAPVPNPVILIFHFARDLVSSYNDIRRSLFKHNQRPPCGILTLSFRCLLEAGSTALNSGGRLGCANVCQSSDAGRFESSGSPKWMYHHAYCF